MNRLTYEEIEIGREVRFPVSLQEASMAWFREITGDENPLHCDEAYARAQGMEGRVVYGMLTASFLSTVAGMYLPGERSLIHEVELKFPKPLLLSESGMLEVTAKVTDKHDVFRRLTLKVAVTNEKGEKVLRGTMKVGVR